MRFLVIGLIVAVLAGVFVVPFAIGYIRGPDASQVRAEADPASVRVLSPLARVATIYGRFLLLYVFVELFVTFSGRGEFANICADTPYSPFSSAGSGAVARLGAVVRPDGTMQVCTAHPSAYQWFLYALVRLPSLVLWGTVLVLVWQLIRRAARGGPFTQQASAFMYLLGLVVLVGTAVAAAISALGADLMDRALLVHPGYPGAGIAVDVLIRAPLEALVPWPALAGAALISFARINLLGVALDEEVKATV